MVIGAPQNPGVCERVQIMVALPSHGTESTPQNSIKRLQDPPRPPDFNENPSLRTRKSHVEFGSCTCLGSTRKFQDSIPARSSGPDTRREHARRRHRFFSWIVGRHRWSLVAWVGWSVVVRDGTWDVVSIRSFNLF